jgi:hypothetical protein
MEGSAMAAVASERLIDDSGSFVPTGERGVTDENLAEEMSMWLVKSGTPRLSSSYSPLRNEGTLSFVLAVVVGFELSMAPFVRNIDVTTLLVLPFLIGPCCWLLHLLGKRIIQIDRARLKPLLIVMLAIVCGWVYFLLRNAFDQSRWPDGWIDALTLAGVVYLSIKLSRASSYRSRRAEAFSMIILLVAITGFLVEGPPIFRQPWFWYLDDALRRAGLDFYVPRSLIALLILMGIWWRAGGWRAGTATASGTMVPPWKWSRSFVRHLTRMLLLLLGLQVAYFPYVLNRNDQLAVPLIGLGILAALVLIVTSLKHFWRSAPNITPTVFYFAPALILFLFAYPYEIWKIGFLGQHHPDAPETEGVPTNIVINGTSFSGLDAAEIAFGINVAFLALGLLMAAIALDNIAEWAQLEVRSGWRQIGRPLVSHLGVVFVASVVILFSAEVWQVAYVSSCDRVADGLCEPHGSRNFTIVAVFLIGACVLIPVIAGASNVRRLIQEMSSDEAAEAAKKALEGGMGKGGVKLNSNRDHSVFAAALAAWQRGGLQPIHLEPLQRLNLFVVAWVYQLLVLGTLTLAWLVIFLLLSLLCVSSADAASWIFQGHASNEIAHLRSIKWTWQSPWLRIATVLAFLTVVERNLRLAADRKERDQVFGTYDNAIRRRLAIFRAMQPQAPS